MGKRRKASRDALEEPAAMIGGCLELDMSGVTAEEMIGAEESFFAEKIRRAREWQEELEAAEGKRATRE